MKRIKYKSKYYITLPDKVVPYDEVEEYDTHVKYYYKGLIQVIACKNI